MDTIIKNKGFLILQIGIHQIRDAQHREMRINEPKLLERNQGSQID